MTANITAYDTEIDDFQAQVVNAGVGVLRGYLANAEKVRVRGVELDGSLAVNGNLSFYASAAFTDGKYVSFPDAPPPLEDTGGPQVKDVSGTRPAGHLQVGDLVRRRSTSAAARRSAARGSSSARSTPAIARRSRRAPARRAIWSSMATRC